MCMGSTTRHNHIDLLSGIIESCEDLSHGWVNDLHRPFSGARACHSASPSGTATTSRHDAWSGRESLNDDFPSNNKWHSISRNKIYPAKHIHPCAQKTIIKADDRIWTDINVHSRHLQTWLVSRSFTYRAIFCCTWRTHALTKCHATNLASISIRISPSRPPPISFISFCRYSTRHVFSTLLYLTQIDLESAWKGSSLVVRLAAELLGCQDARLNISLKIRRASQGLAFESHSLESLDLRHVSFFIEDFRSSAIPHYLAETCQDIIYSQNWDHKTWRQASLYFFVMPQHDMRYQWCWIYVPFSTS